jgi:hypothetical protein
MSGSTKSGHRSYTVLSQPGSVTAGLDQQLEQLRDAHGDAPRLVAGHPIGRREVRHSDMSVIGGMRAIAHRAALDGHEFGDLGAVWPHPYQ